QSWRKLGTSPILFAFRLSVLLIVLTLNGMALGETQAGMNAQEQLFGGDRIATVEIEVSQSAFLKLQSQPRADVPASVLIDGQTFPNAEVHLKGHGSFRPISEKPNLMVRLHPDTS